MVGQTVEFTVQALSPGGGALRYQWLLDGQAIPDATNATLRLNSVTEEQVGEYRARVTNPGGSVDSAPAILQVNILASGSEGPGIEALDKVGSSSQTGQQVVVGPAGVGGSASAESPRTALKSSRPVRLQAQTQARLQGYRGDKVFSTRNAVKDIGEPNHAKVLGGASAWFIYEAPTNGVMRVSTEGSNYDTVLAVYTSPDAAVDYSRLIEVTSDDNGGANGRTSVVQFAARGSTRYYLVVDGVNSAKGRVRLHYEFAVAPVLPQAPVWGKFDPATGQPIGEPGIPPVDMGASVRWGVGVVQPYSPAALSYQWRRNGIEIAGATNAALVVANLNASATGEYAVVVENFAGRTVSAATPLDFQEPIPLILGLADQRVPVGGTAQFWVVLAWEGSFRYRWLFNNAALPGATNATLQLNGVTGARSGEYALEISAGALSLTTRARLIVEEGPVLVSPPLSLTVAVGGTARLEVSVSGAGPLGYQWRLDGVDLSGADGPVLLLESIQARQAGAYTVVVGNPSGAVVSPPAFVTVQQPVRIVAQPVEVIVCENGSAGFAVTVQGTGPMTYQWSLNGTALSGATNATIGWANVQVNQSGLYEVQVVGPLNTVRSRPTPLIVSGGDTLRVVAVRRWADRSAHLILSGPAGRDAYLQASAAFDQWINLSRLTFVNNCLEYVDLGARTLEYRFYRLVLPIQIKNWTALPNSRARLEVDGAEGVTCLVRVSDDLLTWTDLGTAIITGGRLELPDPASATRARRFYQVVLPP